MSSAGRPDVPPPAPRNDGLRRWAAFVTLALLLHAILLVTLHPGFFEIFRKAIVDTEPSRSSGGGPPPDAIVVIRVDEEESETPPPAPTDVRPRTVARPTERPAQPQPGEPRVDILDLVGDAAEPRTGAGTSSVARIPPRPVEITWPRTRRLGHCRDLRLDIRVHVGADGRVLEARAPGGDWPADCVRAALDAARRIRFVPGTVEGHPRAMWTRVRIDFRARG